MIGFALTTSSTFSWFLTIPLTFFLGASVAMFSSPNGNSIMNAVPKSHLGVAGGFIGIARTFGFSMGIAISAMFMVLFKAVFISINGGGPKDAINYIPSYQLMILFGVLFAFISLIITYMRPKIVRVD